MKDDATALAGAIRDGRLTAGEAMAASLAAAASRVDLGALCHVDDEFGRRQAAAADAVAEVAVEAAADVAEGAGAEVAADVVADTVSE